MMVKSLFQIISFIIVLILISQQTYGQPYLNETSRWKQFLKFGESPPGVIYYDDIIIQLEGDTVIENKSYYKVLKTGRHFKYYTQTGDTVVNDPIHEYLDPIREEGKLFYAYDLFNQSEYIMYDFSGAVGDTLLSNDCDRDTILTIDTVYLGSEPRKLFHLPIQYNVAYSNLVEGVGATRGFGWPACNDYYGPTIALQCYSQNGEYIEFCNCGCKQLAVGGENIQETEFSVNPNPFTDEIEIYHSRIDQQPRSIRIVNLMGGVVFEKQLLAEESSEQIALPDMPAGIYIICFPSKEGIASRKLMKL